MTQLHMIITISYFSKYFIILGHIGFIILLQNNESITLLTLYFRILLLEICYSYSCTILKMVLELLEISGIKSYGYEWKIKIRWFNVNRRKRKVIFNIFWIVGIRPRDLFDTIQGYLTTRVRQFILARYAHDLHNW